MENKLNILIDGNNFFYKTLSIFFSFSPKNEKLFDNKNDEDVFIRKLATDLSFILRQFKYAKSIYFLTDFNSWRKSILIDDKESYKINRKEDQKKNSEFINWEKFFNICDKFLDIISKNTKIIPLKINGLEADDLIYLFSDYFFNKNENIIILSSDKDLLQLLRYNEKNNNFIIQFDISSNRKNIYLTKNFLNNTLNNNNDNNIFNLDLIFEKEFNEFNILKQIVNEYNYSIIEINPIKIAFIKIISGDPVDNISSVYEWKSLRGEKEINNRISELKSEKIFEKILENNNDFNIDEIEEYSYFILNEIKKMYNNKINIDEEKFINNLKRNKKLIYLSRNIIPNDLIKKFDEYLSNIKFNDNIINLINLYKEDILKNTEYLLNDNDDKNIIIEEKIFNILKIDKNELF